MSAALPPVYVIWIGRLARRSPGANAPSGPPATLVPVWLNNGTVRLFDRLTEPVAQSLPVLEVWAVNAALEKPSTRAPLASRPSGTAVYFATERIRFFELFVVVI